MSLIDWQDKLSELSYEEKLTLRNFLDEAMHPVDPEFDRHWVEIGKQRRENVRSGKSKTFTLEEVMRELKSGL